MARRVSIPKRKSRKISRVLAMNPSKGLNNLVSPTLIDNREFSEMLNVEYDEGGVVRKRSGYSAVGDSLVYARGLGVFKTEAANQLLTIDNGGLKVLTSNTWSSVAGASFDRTLTPTRTNLWTNPSIETNTTGYTAYKYQMTYAGTGDFTNLGTSTELNLTSSFVVTAVVRRNGNGSDAYYYVKGRGGLSGISIKVSSSGVLAVVKNGVVVVTYSTTLANTTWYQVSIRFNADRTSDVFVDGVLDDSSANTGVINSASQNAYIGTNISGAGAAQNGWVGDIALLRIHNTALTDQEIIDLHNGVDESRDSLVGEWLHNEGSGTSLADSSSNSNDGSITGATWTDNRPTLSSSATQANTGSNSLAHTPSSTPIGHGSVASLTGLTDGTTYVFSAYFFQSAATDYCGITIQGSTTTSVQSDGSWNRLSVTFTASGTTQDIHLINFSGANLFYVDSVMLEETDTLGSYFDGGSTDESGLGYAWTGTENASTSTENTISAPDVTFTQVRDKAYIWNGTDGGSEYDGSTLSRPGTMPKASFAIFFQDRHIVSGVAGQPNRLFISETDDASAFTRTSGQLNNSTEVPGATVFSGTTANFIDVRKNDGDEISGLARYQDVLIIFKRRSIYQLTFDENGDPVITPITAATGCISHRSIDNVENDVYFMSPEGLRVLGNEPNFFTAIRTNVISIRVQQTIDSMNRAYQDKMNALYFDNKYMLAYPTTSDSISGMLAYDKRFGGFTLWNSINPNAMVEYYDTSNEAHFYFMDDNGLQMQEVIKGQYNDNGAAIAAHITSKAQDFGNLDVTKRWESVGLAFRRLSGLVDATIYLDNNISAGSVVLGSGSDNGMGTEMFGIEMLGTVGELDDSDDDISTDNVLRVVVNQNSRTLKFKISNDRLNENFVFLGTIYGFYAQTHYLFDSGNKIYI